MNLDFAAERHLSLPRSPVIEKLSNVAWNKAAFIALWEGQSHLSSMAYVALVAFVSIWAALVAMFAWSVVATLVFCAARERGYPNLLNTMPRPRAQVGSVVWYVVASVVRVVLAGFNAFIFSRCSALLVADKRGACMARRLTRAGVLGVGLTLFGVTTAEHLLRKAGYSGGALLRMSLIGPFLHVPYRVLLSAAFVAVVTDALGLLTL